ncbi:hypothetical protein BO94DRAFT_620661 [Aspergillus sclerotioniger CBS 115572]|uniref:Ecp2 effector protein domain-containing protein n=1 Tax=Aspergillus sclerotioniger CBS 115572 TaxID=1450535 RepID=A0A317X9L2_9EURO|nr:hypothetical protein BO94DRAFT_620661 [Aspergillus sclerotioniger CBS 115572]PWY95189.1 hypothetical protein BO94DRAFT_620661 [Aspergillus sclerotioniger CBS 115572]
MQIFQSFAGLLALASVGVADFLFHGSSIVIYPSAVSVHPKDSEYVGANFFSYVTPQGYFSFGWWLDPVPNTDTSHCSPKPRQIDWFEYTSTGNCTAVECRVHAVNYLVQDPSKPSIDSDYVATALDLGNGEAGRLALSYFDRPLGGYAVGSRNVLSGDDVDRKSIRDCHDAFETLTNIQQRWKVQLPFELINPCGEVSGESLQYHLGL